MRASGIDERTPESGEEAVAGATSPLVTRDMLATEIAGLRADVYRALWIQVAVIAVIAVIAEAIG